ncbi:MAG: RNase adapter RapZ [Myxococcales bacterium]|nr:RNase adapter RapZ [Polyangiaceae bacterium]MDW8250435.1 RNase adapter RapZ [Myxococcales bacterium]
MMPSPPLVVVVTGMSGAGKSTALRALEDMRFYCVDNLPTPLIRETLEVCAAGGLARIALGLDVRVRGFFEQAGTLLDEIRQRDGLELRVLCLDATDEALLRRYSETRRPHPLSVSEGNDGTAAAVLDGIRSERERLGPLRARATHIIDTTNLSAHDLRRSIVAMLGPAEQLPRMSTRLLSFGFKYGMPVDADVVFDVRFLDNPHHIPALRELPGTHPNVAAHVLGHQDTIEFLDHARGLLGFALPRYEREGKAYLTIAVGCTGGRHRSVAIAERLADELRFSTGFPIRVVHRDLQRDPGNSSEAP